MSSSSSNVTDSSTTQEPPQSDDALTCINNSIDTVISRSLTIDKCTVRSVNEQKSNIIPCNDNIECEDVEMTSTTLNSDSVSHSDHPITSEIESVSEEITQLQHNLKKARKRLYRLKKKQLSCSTTNEPDVTPTSGTSLLPSSSSSSTPCTISTAGLACSNGANKIDSVNGNSFPLNTSTPTKPVSNRGSILRFFSPLPKESSIKSSYSFRSTIVNGFVDFQTSNHTKLALVNRCNLDAVHIEQVRHAIRNKMNKTSAIDDRLDLRKSLNHKVESTEFSNYQSKGNHQNDDCIIECDYFAKSEPITDACTRLPLKYFHLDQSIHRIPPYYGTWSKQSLRISFTNPLCKDTDLINYDLDSDEEWEEGDNDAAGDEVGSQDEKSSADDDSNDECQDGFFVPAGHLSEEEMIHNESECNNVEDVSDCLNEGYSNTFDVKGEREDAKTRFENWYANASRVKLKRLVPKCVGCLWYDCSEEYDRISQQFSAYKTYLIQQPVMSSIKSSINHSDNKTISSSKDTKAKSKPTIKPKSSLLKSKSSDRIDPTVASTEDHKKQLPSPPKLKKRKITFTKLNP